MGRRWAPCTRRGRRLAASSQLIGAGGDSRLRPVHDPVRCRIDSLHGVGFRARDPDRIIGYQNPVCGSANFDRRGWLQRSKRNLNFLYSGFRNLPFH